MLRLHVLAIRARVISSEKVSDISDPGSAFSVTKSACDDLTPPRTLHASDAWSLWCVSVRYDVIIRYSLLLLVQDMLQWDLLMICRHDWWVPLIAGYHSSLPTQGGATSTRFYLGNEEEIEVFIKTHQCLKSSQLNWPNPLLIWHFNAGHLPRCNNTCSQSAVCYVTCSP